MNRAMVRAGSNSAFRIRAAGNKHIFEIDYLNEK
jgi:hypothetical protein